MKADGIVFFKFSRGGCCVFHFVNFSIYHMLGQIEKAKSICECLIASEGADLKLEEAFCLFLLGQVYFSVSFWFYFLHCFIKFFWISCRD